MLPVSYKHHLDSPPFAALEAVAMGRGPSEVSVSEIGSGSWLWPHYSSPSGLADRSKMTNIPSALGTSANH